MHIRGSDSFISNKLSKTLNHLEDVQDYSKKLNDT